jgi:WD40 repeat protein
MTSLQDPGNIPPVTDQIRKNVPSHRNPVLCLKWFPSGFELDMKKSFAAMLNSSGQEVHQFATISSDGQVLLWDKRFQDAQKKQITDLSTVVWKAGYGFQLFRPEGGGQLGGSHIAFKKNQKQTIFTGSSDQGELFVCDWSVRAGDDGVTKNDPLIRYWNQ